ncbi:hypothetical protein [Altererythrobacter sp. ZODW24]|uniref:hypothetical protein n=1 Tax=Altererythrobacter sp. ZODW24 TaxID=2185142 RepID=UPI000DF7C86B|nr:hypothetical protein [Altererythrobacter sp. ZODW24]
MTISRCESPEHLRRIVKYEQLSDFSFAPSEPDSINFQIGTEQEEELVELECLASGKKTIFVWRDGSNVPVHQSSDEFLSWSDGLKRKVDEMLYELSDWESKCRVPGGAWHEGNSAENDNDSLL